MPYSINKNRGQEWWRIGPEKPVDVQADNQSFKFNIGAKKEKYASGEKHVGE